MTEKFEEFMKKNTPPAEGALRRLELPQKKNWVAGLALSGALAATFAVMMVNRSVEDIYSEDLIVSFEDEVEELEEVQEMFEEL